MNKNRAAFPPNRRWYSEADVRRWGWDMHCAKETARHADFSHSTKHAEVFLRSRECGVNASLDLHNMKRMTLSTPLPRYSGAYSRNITHRPPVIRLAQCSRFDEPSKNPFRDAPGVRVTTCRMFLKSRRGRVSLHTDRSALFSHSLGQFTAGDAKKEATKTTVRRIHPVRPELHLHTHLPRLPVDAITPRDYVTSWLVHGASTDRWNIDRRC